MKSGLKSLHLKSADDVQHKTLCLFHEIPPKRFEDELHKLRMCYQSAIRINGDYVTK